MPRSLQQPLPPMEVQTLSRTRESAEPHTGTAGGKVDSRPRESSLTALLTEAVEATGCSEKEAAIAQGYEPTYWSRIKAGEKQAHLERIARLPEPMQREFVTRYARQLKMQ